jgi:hypothetical protein
MKQRLFMSSKPLDIVYNSQTHEDFMKPFSRGAAMVRSSRIAAPATRFGLRPNTSLVFALLCACVTPIDEPKREAHGFRSHLGEGLSCE